MPSFGDPKARVLALGLAPGAHGSNRTGRPFTGDGSGEFLYPVLYETGFASQPKATSRDDGMSFTVCGSPPWAAARRRATSPRRRSCATARPGSTKRSSCCAICASWCASGASRSTACSAHAQRAGQIKSRASYTFRHGAEYTLPGGLHMIASFHPSLQNTNTGKLTRPMFLKVFQRARTLAGI